MFHGHIDQARGGGRAQQAISVERLCMKRVVEISNPRPDVQGGSQ